MCDRGTHELALQRLRELIVASEEVLAEVEVLRGSLAV